MVLYILSSKDVLIGLGARLTNTNNLKDHRHDLEAAQSLRRFIFLVFDYN